MSEQQKPRIAFVPGDPNGIGPELTAKVLSSPTNDADILLLANPRVIEFGEQTAAKKIKLTQAPGDLRKPWQTNGGDVFFLPQEENTVADISPGKATAEGGGTSLKELELAVQMADDGIVDAVVFAPLNKQAMKSGGMRAQDELHHLAELLKYDGHISEINIMDAGIWTSRVTSHVALRQVPEMISGKRIKASARLIESALQNAGVKKPRVAIAALNPHAGDGGNFGNEEIEVIAPAVEELRAEGMHALGPYPADTLFRRAIAGEADAIVTMYHDQGQIALKLQGFERGVSVLGGLPVPVATPAHGTAYDIAGHNKAFTGATEAALAVAVNMAKQRRAQKQKGKQ